MTLKELSNSEIENLINEWIHSERNRKILRRKLIDGMTHETISEEVDMSVRQVKKIIKEKGEELEEKVKSTEVAL